jgi:hypothetical protein
LLLALGSEPLRCGVPTVEISAAEIPPAVMITEGRTAQGFPYSAGGVSSEEREVLQASGKAYNVQLTFAEKGGAYLSDINLVITDAKGGEIIGIKADGPLFYIQLPPGKYRVRATFKNETKQLQSLVVAKGKILRQTLVWDSRE